MDIGQILPGLGALAAIIAALVAALRWRRQDALDSINAGSTNVRDAMSLKNDAMADLARLKTELIAAQIENARLLAILRRNNIDPSR